MNLPIISFVFSPLTSERSMNFNISKLTYWNNSQNSISTSKPASIWHAGFPRYWEQISTNCLVEFTSSIVNTSDLTKIELKNTANPNSPWDYAREGLISVFRLFQWLRGEAYIRNLKYIRNWTSWSCQVALPRTVTDINGNMCFYLPVGVLKSVVLPTLHHRCTSDKESYHHGKPHQSYIAASLAQRVDWLPPARRVWVDPAVCHQCAPSELPGITF